MFGVSVTLLILLAMGKYTNSENTRSLDYDSAWDELFGHLSTGSVSAASKGPNKVEWDKIPGKFSKPKITDEELMIPPSPPSPPFVFNSGNGKLPSIGANSYGNMEGIAISQNRGISIAMYMVNSSYNSFNTVFGESKIAKIPAKLPTKIFK